MQAMKHHGNPHIALLIGITLATRPALPDENPAEATSSGPNTTDPEARAAQREIVEMVLKRMGEIFRKKGAPAAQVDPAMLMPHYEAESRKQFRPVLTTELQFIDRVCKPTPEQKETIKAAGDASLRLTVKKYAEVRLKVEQDGFRSWQEADWPHPRKLILDALAESVQRTLSADQAQRYQQELEKRSAARKRATVLYVVTKLDKELLLSWGQQKQMVDITSSNWKDSWAEITEHLEYGDHYMPVLPDDQVLPILSETQKQIWNGMRKKEHSVRGWTGFGFVHPLEDEEETKQDEDIAEKDSQAVKDVEGNR
jgi:hypothetical protein